MIPPPITPRPSRPPRKFITRAEKTPPTNAARRAGRNAKEVGAGRTSSRCKPGWGSDSAGSERTKRICGARQPEQKGVPVATAMPQLGQKWSTSAKLQEMASQQQTGGIGGLAAASRLVQEFLCSRHKRNDCRMLSTGTAQVRNAEAVRQWKECGDSSLRSRMTG
jgi:hypothetical protein